MAGIRRHRRHRGTAGRRLIMATDIRRGRRRHMAAGDRRGRHPRTAVASLLGANRGRVEDVRPDHRPQMAEAICPASNRDKVEDVRRDKPVVRKRDTAEDRRRSTAGAAEAEAIISRGHPVRRLGKAVRAARSTERA
jgi:hypothetical protein